MSNKKPNLKILQYNLRRSYNLTRELFGLESVNKYDIIALQEPWARQDTATTTQPDKDNYHLLYPEEAGSRVCFYISKAIDLKACIYEEKGKDYIMLSLKTGLGKWLHIHNIYNESPTALSRNEQDYRPVMTRMYEELKEHEEGDHIIIGDFNLHHRMWGGDQAKEDKESDELIWIMELHNMELVLPQGTPTYTENCSTTIDLVFTSASLKDRVLQCGIDETVSVFSDHEPIATELYLEIPQAAPDRRRNWKTMDEERLITSLRSSTLLTFARWIPLDTHQQIEEAVLELVADIHRAIDDSTTECRIVAKSKPGFTTECKEAQMHCRRCKKRWQKHRNEGRLDTQKLYAVYVEARNKKNYLIKRTTKKSFRAFVKEACESAEQMWKKTRWSRDPTPRKPMLPPLKDGEEVIHDPREKAKLLIKAFFPPPVEADLQDTLDYDYPEDKRVGTITTHEVGEAIRALAPKKAPGSDKIPNHLLKKIAPTIQHLLARVFNACLEQAYCPSHFKETVTIPLRKPGKSDYSQVKSYRPIALLNTIGKVLEFIVAKRISYLAEQHKLLPEGHMGARRLRSTDHGIHLMIERIYAAWNKNNVASMLLLDVAGAFDNVSHERLIHNLKRKGIDKSIVDWIRSFLKDRTTILKLTEYESPKTVISIGIPQGSPVSPILYLFYNSELIEDCEKYLREGVETSGYADDIGLIAQGPNTATTTKILTKVHEEVCVPWARRHGSVFSPPKYQLLHVTRKRNMNLEEPIILPDTTIHPREEATYLGLQFDSRLSWKGQKARVKYKTLKSMGALARISQSTWGAKLTAIRQIYNATVIPQATYACSAWYAPSKKENTKTAIVRALESVQGKALRIATGAFRATSLPALDVEAFVTPIQHTLERAAEETALRIMATPSYQTIISARSKRKNAIQTPLNRLTKNIEKRCGANGRLEKVLPFIVPPNWEPPNIYIDVDRDRARQRVQEVEEKRSPHYFTDGSGINGKVGTACVDGLTRRKAVAYLGKEEDYTVYSAELAGILLALLTAKQATIPLKAITIFTDNQAAIRAIHRPGISSGQSMVRGACLLYTSPSPRDA
jgi:exonuclease III